MKNKRGCRRYHVRRHGKAWDGSRCPVCCEVFTRPRSTPLHWWKMWRWKRAHPVLSQLDREAQNELRTQK